MTAIDYVSKREMVKKTGADVAGYALPKEDRILIREGLPEDLRKEVVAHEIDHIEKGEEGPFPWPAVIQAGASILGGVIGSKSADKAAGAAEDAARQQIGYARETRDLIREDVRPYRDAGYTGLRALMNLTGLTPPPSVLNPSGGRSQAPTDPAMDYPWKQSGKATPHDVYMAYKTFRPDGTTFNTPSKLKAKQEYYSDRERADQLYWHVIAPGLEKQAQTAMQPAEGEYIPANEPTPEEMVKSDPSYDFRFKEGQRALTRGAAASGGLLSGGAGRALTRYGQDYVSTEYSNIYNRISNIAGLGQVANQQNMHGALAYGRGAHSAVGDAGYTRASAYVGQGNAWGNALEQIGALDWRSPQKSESPFGPYRDGYRF